MGAILSAFTSSASVSVLSYGADPAGVNDSTAAITNATTAALAAGQALYVPAGTYKITSKLNWTQTGLVVAGAGRSVTSIIQATANTGVVQAGGRFQNISGLTLGYASQRPSGETNSVCLSLASASTFGVSSRYSDLSLVFGQTGIANDASNTVNAIAFSCVFDNIRINHWSQSAINLVNPAGQATGCVWRNIYCSNDNSGAQASASYPIHLVGWNESVFDQLNVESSVLTTHAIVLDTVGGMVFNSVHVEANTFNGDLTSVFDLTGSSDCTLTVNAATLFNNTFAGATKNGFIRHDVFSSSAVVHGLWTASNTISGGGAYIIDFGSAQNCRDTVWTGGLAPSDNFTGRYTGGAPGANDILVYNNDIVTTGIGLQVAEGSNAKQGTAVLSGGSAVVSDTAVTANSRILLTSNVDGGTPGWLRVSARTAGTSFTITSSSGTDTSTVAYEIFEPG